MAINQEQLDKLEGYLTKRHLDEVLDLNYLDDEGIYDPRLRRLVKAYTKISKQLKRYLRDRGVREGTQ